MPFGFHLTVDTLPSEYRNSEAITPTFGYGAPFERQRDFNLENNALLSARFPGIRF